MAGSPPSVRMPVTDVQLLPHGITAESRMHVSRMRALPLHKTIHAQGMHLEWRLVCVQGQRRSWTLSGGAVPSLTQAHFRKSSQWIALTRGHAELLANDTALFPALAGDYPCASTAAWCLGPRV